MANKEQYDNWKCTAVSPNITEIDERRTPATLDHPNQMLAKALNTWVVRSVKHE